MNCIMVVQTIPVGALRIEGIVKADLVSDVTGVADYENSMINRIILEIGVN